MFLRSLARGGARRAQVGILLILAAGLIFSANDTLAKILLAEVPVGQVLFIRCIPVLLLLTPFLMQVRRAARPSPRTLAICFAVMILSAADITCHYAALVYLPLADVATFYLASPICVTALSVVLLGEPISRRQMLAVGLGFLGVLIALQPSAGLFRPASLIALAGTLCFSLMIVLARLLRTLSPAALVACQMLGGLLFGAASIPLGWTPLAWPVFAAICLIGVLAAAGFACLNGAVRFAPVSVTAPFQYMALVWAALFGFLVFADVPSAATVIGGVAVVGSGLVIWSGERSRGEPAAAEAAAR